MSFRVVVLLAAVCLAGCASMTPVPVTPNAQPPSASPPDKMFADGFFAHCLADSITQADDHHSDISTVALAVQHMCIASFDMIVEMNTRGMSSAEKQTFYQRAATAELPTITQMIAAERVAEKSN